jgi:hypothetical protein
MSRMEIALGAGPHSLTITPIQTADFGGSAFLHLAHATTVPTPVPEPPTLWLMAVALLAIGGLQIGRTRAASAPR